MVTNIRKYGWKRLFLTAEAVLFFLGTLFVFVLEAFIGYTVILVSSLMLFGFLYVLWLQKARILDFSGKILQKGRYFPSIEDTIKDTVLDLAQNEIICFQGDLAPEFFAVPKILSKLEGPSASILMIEIVFGSMINVRSIELLRLVKKGNISLYQLPVEPTCSCEKRKFHHFLSVDDKHVWLEYCHQRGGCGDGMEFKDEVYVASVCREYFEGLKKHCKKIDPKGNLIDAIGRRNFVNGAKNNEWIPATNEEIKALAEALGETCS